MKFLKNLPLLLDFCVLDPCPELPHVNKIIKKNREKVDLIPRVDLVRGFSYFFVTLIWSPKRHSPAMFLFLWAPN